MKHCSKKCAITSVYHRKREPRVYLQSGPATMLDWRYKNNPTAQIGAITTTKNTMRNTPWHKQFRLYQHIKFAAFFYGGTKFDAVFATATISTDSRLTELDSLVCLHIFCTILATITYLFGVLDGIRSIEYGKDSNALIEISMCACHTAIHQESKLCAS